MHDHFVVSHIIECVASHHNVYSDIMDDTKDLQDKIVQSASNIVGDLVYTVVFDTCNEIIAAGGVDQEKVLEAANTVVNKYVDGGVKVRKKPAPRPKVPKTSVKEKPVDILKAASRKLNSLTDNVVWVVHPESDEYSYTTSVKLATGYPVKNNMTHKVVLVANDESTAALTVKDAKIALSLGLDIDYDSVEQ